MDELANMCNPALLTEDLHGISNSIGDRRSDSGAWHSPWRQSLQRRFQPLPQPTHRRQQTSRGGSDRRHRDDRRREPSQRDRPVQGADGDGHRSRRHVDGQGRGAGHSVDLLTAPHRTRNSPGRRRSLAPLVRPAGRLDEAPPATASTPLCGPPSRPHRRLEASRPHPASPGHAKPPNTAEPRHPSICVSRPPRSPLHRTPRRLAARPKPPSTPPKVPQMPPLPH